MKCSFERLPYIAVLGLILVSAAAARTWTDVQGRAVEAEFVSSDGTVVTLLTDGGKKVSFPLSRLSAGDLEFIRGQSAKKESKAEDAEALNFNAPWPDSVRFDEDPQIEIMEENTEAKRFVYESANFRFVCDVRLSKQVVKGFSVMFESTYQYCRALPLAIDGGKRTDGKFQILLFETKEDYIEAGAPPTSAGVFMSSKAVVMVPLVGLGVKPVGSGYMLDRDVSNGTLIHELTHQLTPLKYFAPGAMGWFSEGIAEYVAATPYRSGRFKVKSNFDDIVAYATEYGKDRTRGRALGKKITAPALKDFFAMKYDAFAGPDANFNYGMGLLLTTYFLHLDGDGDAARMKDFLKALREGKRGEQALEALLGGRSYEEMEEAISKGWKSKGVKIEFRRSESSASDAVVTP